jgi:hypothetical protein
MAANPSIQLGTDGNWAIKEDNLLAYKKDGTRFFNKEFDFTRGSLATFVDKDGLIKVSGATDAELVANGDFATDSDWTLGNGWSISGGTANASSSFDNLVQTGFNFIIEKNYKVTYEVKNYVNGNIRFQFTGGATLDGTTRNSNGIYTQYVKATANHTNFRFRGTNFTGSIDNVSVKEIQADVPRIDFTNDTTGHLLLEPQSTNLFLYSEDFENSDWNKNAGTTITNNYAISPDGTQTAARYLGTGSSGLGDKFTLSAADHTISFWVKSNNGSNQFCRLIGESSQVSSDILVTTEWNRISYTFTASGLSDKTNGIFRDSSNNDIDILIYGAQLEEKSYPTSYIPTYGSSATRNAEICNNSGSAQDFNSEEGVLYAEIKTLTELSTFRQINLNDGTTVNRIYISKRADNNNIEFRMDNPLGSLNFSIPKNTTNNYLKVAFRYGLNNFAVFIDGVNQNVNPTGNTFSANTFNRLELTSPINQPFYGKTKGIYVLNEALTDDELQQLTT